jgi:hypothetical protein
MWIKLNWAGLVQVAGSQELSMDLSGSVKCWKILDYLSNY